MIEFLNLFPLIFISLYFDKIDPCCFQMQICFNSVLDNNYLDDDVFNYFLLLFFVFRLSPSKLQNCQNYKTEIFATQNIEICKIALLVWIIWTIGFNFFTGV